MNTHNTINEYDLRNKLYKDSWFSPWFIAITILLMIPDFTYTLSRISFLHKGPPFAVRCNIPDLNDVTWSFEEIQSITQPSFLRNNCTYYVCDYKKLSQESYSDAREIVDRMPIKYIKTCNDVVYNQETGFETIYKEFTLFCCTYLENLMLISPVFGSFLGYLIIVPLSDIYGRKSILNLGLNILVITILMMNLMSCSHLFLLARVFSGMGHALVRATTEALCVELTSPSIRNYRYCIITIGAPGLAYLITPFLSNQIKDWRTLQWFCSIGLLYFPLVTWYVPESPHWLFSKNFIHEAMHVAETMKTPEMTKNEIFNVKKEYGNFWKPVFQHFKEMKGLNCKKFWFTAIVVSLVASFYSKNYAEKYEAQFLDDKNELLCYFRGVPEFISLFFSLSFSQIIGRKISIILLQFCAMITCFFLTQFKDTWERVVLYYTLEITTCTVFALARLHGVENSPSSHRCTVLGIFGSGYTMMTILIFILFNNVNVSIYFLVTGILSTITLGLVWFTYKDNADKIFTTYKDLPCK